MTKRDRMAGWVHAIEFTVATVGLVGWWWWVTHPERNYHECKCK